MQNGGAKLVVSFLGAQPTPDRGFPEVATILTRCGKTMERVSPESIRDLINIAMEFENTEKGREVEVHLSENMVEAIVSSFSFSLERAER